MRALETSFELAGSSFLLKALRPAYEKHHEVKVNQDVLEVAVRESSARVKDRFLPPRQGLPWGRWAVNFMIEARCFHVMCQLLFHSENRSET